MDIARVDLSCGGGFGAAATQDCGLSTLQGRWARAAGVSLCALLPAAFWCAVIWIVGHGLGNAPDGAALAAIGTLIAAFLTVISSALMSRH